MPQGNYVENGISKKRSDMNEEEKYQSRLLAQWRKTKEYRILNKYAGEEIEEVPDEYRDKIKMLRKYGLGKVKSATSDTYMEIIEWLETHDGKMPQSGFGPKRKA